MYIYIYLFVPLEPFTDGQYGNEIEFSPDCNK